MEQTMQAITYTKYGPPDVLHLTSHDKPAPKDSEVLVRVRAASVNYGDLLARNFKNVSAQEFNMPGIFYLLARLAFGFNQPKKSILGSEFSGEVESTGSGVTAFKPGDPVFGYLSDNMGAYAEYICVQENGLIAKRPAHLTHEEAASIAYGALMALPMINGAKLQAGHKVLILGASGGIGSAAVQIARHLGAHVTGVCGTERMDYVKNLGADEVIDYTREDFSRNGQTYDLILDVLGRGDFEKTKKSLTGNGRYVCASFKGKQILQMLMSARSSKKLVCQMAPGSREDFLEVVEMIQAGKIKSIVDRAFPKEQAANAHTYAESGRKQGNVVIML